MLEVTTFRRLLLSTVIDPGFQELTANKKVNNTTSSSVMGGGGASVSKEIALKQAERTVAKLRPKLPITVSDKASIFEVAKAMAASRADAALLVGGRGNLSGIITDNDVTRRVVSQSMDPNTTAVNEVMTKNPKCVHNFILRWMLWT